MGDSPVLNASDYSPTVHKRVQQTCLHVATVLGDLTEEITIVGGLVPSLLIPERDEPDFELHVGTMDLDLGLSASVLNEDRYQEIAEKLRAAGFVADLNPEGNVRFWRWRAPIAENEPEVTVDFLIAEREVNTPDERVLKLASDFGALAMKGLQLVWRDRVLVPLDGVTLDGTKAIRDVGVCGPGAFVILKARALRGRDKPKDAYDLYYMLKHYGSGVKDIAEAILPLLDDPDAEEAIGWLADDFLGADYIGPVRTAVFQSGEENEDIQADAAGLVQELLELLERSG